uniref:Uncharacterized protein n=1 Tax=Siphoviridae sp. ctDmR33 TaxID=2825389 RepID=A0A8S5UX75_9CAUD|nr:MAG TPA: hypothetical protein [Siphoviridae sp. ctDmR33]
MSNILDTMKVNPTNLVGIRDVGNSYQNGRN